MTVYIVSGGSLDNDFLYSALMGGSFDILIAAESGAEACISCGFKPDLIVGDFDSAGFSLLEKAEMLGIPVEKHPARKDETDTELAIRRAVSMIKDAASQHDASGNSDKPVSHRLRIFGATGTRLDHVHANITMLARLAEDPETAGIDAAILDPHNFIRVVTKGLRMGGGRAASSGAASSGAASSGTASSGTASSGAASAAASREYVSVYALSEVVEGLNLKGFSYPVDGMDLHRSDTIGTSNEITGSSAEITFSKGTLLVIRSKD